MNPQCFAEWHSSYSSRARPLSPARSASCAASSSPAHRDALFMRPRPLVRPSSTTTSFEARIADTQKSYFTSSPDPELDAHPRLQEAIDGPAQALRPASSPLNEQDGFQPGRIRPRTCAALARGDRFSTPRRSSPLTDAMSYLLKIGGHSWRSSPVREKARRRRFARSVPRSRANSSPSA